MIEVPFVENPDMYSCGEASALGVMRYFDTRLNPSLEDLKKLSSSTATGITSTVGLALTMHACGLKVEHCFDESPEDTIYRQSNLKLISDDSQERFNELDSLGNIRRSVLYDTDFERIIDEGKPIICLVDFSKFHHKAIRYSRKLPFAGHFVTVVGVDSSNFYINQPGLYEPRDAQPIGRSTFFESFRSPGTFGGAIIIHGWGV